MRGIFAWALHAGVSYDVTQNFTVDLDYRYLDIGDGSSGKNHAYDGSGTGDGLEFDNIHSSDIMLGARWKFGCCGRRCPSLSNNPPQHPIPSTRHRPSRDGRFFFCATLRRADASG